MEPTYLLWTPRPVGAAIRFNATPLAAPRWPSGPAAFYAEVLRDLGLDAAPERWDVMPYRAAYHGEPDAADWRDRWKLNWRVTVPLDAPPAGPFEEGYETGALGDEAPRLSDEPPCFLLSDFPDEAALDAAQRALAGALGISADGFERFEVAGGFWQLQADLGPQPYADDAPRAREAEAICRTHGGWPTFDERIRALD